MVSYAFRINGENRFFQVSGNLLQENLLSYGLTFGNDNHYYSFSVSLFEEQGRRTSVRYETDNVYIDVGYDNLVYGGITVAVAGVAYFGPIAVAGAIYYISQACTSGSPLCPVG